MQANETTFQRMVEGTKQFQVPLYQRPYSWGQEELERLWGDVTEQAERDQETRPGGSAGHFWGRCGLDNMYQRGHINQEGWWKMIDLSSSSIP